MFSYERSVDYPEGTTNVIFAQRGIRPLPRLPITAADPLGHAPDTRMLYAYPERFNGIVASHTRGTNMGTDWRDNDSGVEPVVDTYQGDRQNYGMPDAPRANSEGDSIGGWRPNGLVNLALEKGYVLSFEASSDHISTHISSCNIYGQDITRESVLDAFKKRDVFAAIDNILADVRSGDHMIGDVFATTSLPSARVKLAGTEIRQGARDQGQRLRLLHAAGLGRWAVLAAGQFRACGQDEPLLHTRGTGGWAAHLSISHVDHVRSQTLNHG